MSPPELRQPTGPTGLIGLIGLGTMGAAMAGVLQQHGHQLVVHDRRPEAATAAIAAGATWVDGPAGVAERANVVLTSLPGPAEFDDVVCGAGGLRDALRPGSLLVDLSTNSPGVVQRIGRLLAERGVECLDAPVSGGAHGARAGTLTIWVGGSEGAVGSVRPVLEAIGGQVLHVGALGSGCVVKLVHNLVAAGLNQVLTEGLTLGVRAGVDPVRLWSALSQGAVGRARVPDRMRHVMARQVEPAGFRLDLAEKDARLARQLATDLGVPVHLLDATFSELREAVNDGHGHLDAVAVAGVQERRAGVSIVAPRDDLERAAAELAAPAGTPPTQYGTAARPHAAD